MKTSQIHTSSFSGCQYAISLASAWRRHKSLKQPQRDRQMFLPDSMYPLDKIPRVDPPKYHVVFRDLVRRPPLRLTDSACLVIRVELGSFVTETTNFVLIQHKGEKLSSKQRDCLLFTRNPAPPSADFLNTWHRVL